VFSIAISHFSDLFAMIFRNDKCKLLRQPEKTIMLTKRMLSY
jgi:hypothetical protein